MKNCNYLIISVVLFGLLFFLPSTFSQITQKDDIEGISLNTSMYFNIALNKTEYFQLEPISVRCKFSNETKESQTTLIPSFLSEGGLEVNFNGERKRFNTISPFRILLRRFPVTFQPGENYEEEITLETSLDEFFPQPGTYAIRLLLTGSEGKLLRSNQVKLTILEPKGIDKEAFDFIQKNKANNSYQILFAWNNDIKLENGKTLLEEFVSKYSASIYGEIAIYQLGNYYFGNHELEKAKFELEKLRFSRNPRIAKSAKATLLDVEKNFPAKENEKPQ